MSADHRRFLTAFTVVFSSALLPLGAASAKAQSASSAAAPRSFEALAVSPTEIDLYWLPPKAGPAECEIVRDGTLLSRVKSADGRYSDRGLVADSLHHYEIRPIGAPITTYRHYTERSFAEWPVSSTSRLATADFDIVIAQASSGGTAAAIEAARRGLKVALVEPTTRIGGMPGNGLSATDLRRPEHAEGIFIQFKNRVKQLYTAEGMEADGFSYEPRVANQAMKSLLYDQKRITLFRRARLSRVEKHEDPQCAGSTIVDAVVIEELKPDGSPTGRKARLRGKFFVDATDCGDLAAWAGAPFRLGREARSAREPHNGVIYYDRAGDKPLPGSTGKADRRIQAYSYLLTVKDYGKGQDKTIPMPAGYHKEDFVHTPEWLKSWAVTSGTMPGSKMELNQHPQGGDIQEINYRYPLLGYADRAKIDAAYRNHVLGYLYYIQTEQGQKQVGLPDDEYRDSGGFPPLLYVREGRRIIGDELLDESDVQQSRSISRPRSIGLGDYPMDSHAVRRKTDWSTPDMGEGEWWLYRQTPVHQLPAGILLPKTLQNVMVTTSVSSTHVSFGTYRLEPVRMTFGQTAAVYAALCLRYGLNIHQLPTRQVQDELLPHAANRLPEHAKRLTYFTDLNPEAPEYRPIMVLTSRGLMYPGDQFKPNASVTNEECLQFLQLLAARATKATDAGPESLDPLLIAQMGTPVKTSVIPTLPSLLPAGQLLTRAALAKALTALFPWHIDQQVAAIRHFSPASSSAGPDDADRLFAMGIDPILWDGVHAIRRDGTLNFKPEAKVTRAQLFAALYLVQLRFGPAFNDHPVDSNLTTR